MASQAQKAEIFRGLHREGAFLMPNPFDVGSARILATLGFPALATTSAGYAFSRGRQDHNVAREEMLDHISQLAAATELPVSADLGNGFGDAAAVVAETIGLAAEAGAVGGSIEDATGDPDRPLHEITEAADRVAAAVDAAKGLPFPFTVTARAENYLVGHADLKDVIRRLQAYQEAGAHVLYAPGLSAEMEIESLVRSVDRSVNVVVGLRGARLTLDRLKEIGVRRISVGSALARMAYGVVVNAGRQMATSGDFSFADDLMTFDQINGLFDVTGASA